MLDRLAAAEGNVVTSLIEVYKALEPNKYSSTTGMGGRDEAWREIELAKANYPGS